MKKIWIFTVGEPPLFETSERKHRSGILSEYLSFNNEVIYWSSNFFHQKKEKFHAKNYQIKKNLIFKAIETLGYKKNVSIRRFLDQIYFAIRIKKILKNYPEKPDLLIVSMPTPELTYVISRYALKNKIKFVVDVRDMWPEVMIISMKHFLMKIFFKIFFSYMKFLNFSSLNKANSIVSISKEFLEWSQSQTKKTRSKSTDRFFYLTLPRTERLNLNKSVEQKKINICFYGIISFKKFDFLTLINFCEKYNKNQNFKFHIYGSGDDEDKLKEFSKNNSLLDFLGYADQKKIAEISSMSDYGLAFYQPTFDFKKSIPNKVIEYLSYDLNILSCLEGATNNFLKENKIGNFYNYKNFSSFEEMIFSLKKNPKNSNFKRIYDRKFNYDIIYNEYKKHLESFLK